MKLSIDLFNWDQTLSLDENEKIENVVDELPKSLEDLVELIRIAEESYSSDIEIPFPTRAPGGENETWEISISSDTLYWVIDAILSTKYLRHELERKVGTLRANAFYFGLIEKYRVCIDQESTLTLNLPGEFGFVEHSVMKKINPDFSPQVKSTSAQLKKWIISPDQKQIRSVKTRFELKEYQVLFDGKEIKVGSGMAFEILQTLIKSFGVVVPFHELNSSNKCTEASEAIRTAIVRIKKALQANNIPVFVENRKATGYRLLPCDM